MSSINRCLSGVIRDPLVWNVVTGITASSLEDASRPATTGHRKPPPTVAAQRRIPRSGLAPSARFNPTAFQAVSFQRPVPRLRQGEDGGIQTQRARGLRPEVSHGVVYEVPVQDIDGQGSGTCPRSDPAGMPGARNCDRKRIGVAGPHPYAAGGVADSGPGENGAGVPQA